MSYGLWSTEILNGIVQWIADQLGILPPSDPDKIQLVMAFLGAITAVATLGAVVIAAWQLRAFRLTTIEQLDAAQRGLTQQIAATQTSVMLQVTSAREEARKWETVKACNLQDTDPTLHQATKEIREAAKGGMDYSPATMKSQTHNILTVLNSLDALAIGVAEGVYVESIVRDNLGSSIEKAVDRFLYIQHEGIEAGYFKALTSLREKWRAPVVQVP